MQTYLHNAQTEAAKLGVALDPNTQMLIDQSKAANIWQDAMTPAPTMIGTLQSLNTTIGNLDRALRGLPPITDLTVNTDYTTTGNPPGTPILPGAQAPTAPGAATGGQVTSTGIDYFAGGGISMTPVGSDIVPAMLTPGELVLNTAEQSAFMSQSPSVATSTSGTPTSGAAAGPGGGDITVTTILDGAVVANTVVKRIMYNTDSAYTKWRAALGLPS
jgi:hypothetical protein